MSEPQPSPRPRIALPSARSTARRFDLLASAAPHVRGMAGRLRTPRPFGVEPANSFGFTGYG